MARELATVLLLECPQSPSVIGLAPAVGADPSGHLLAHHTVFLDLSDPKEKGWMQAAGKCYPIVPIRVQLFLPLIT